MKQSLNKYVMFIAIFIVLSGCATPYQRESANYSGGGYSETKIDSNILKNILKRDAIAYHLNSRKIIPIADQ